MYIQNVLRSGLQGNDVVLREPIINNPNVLSRSKFQ